MMKIRVHLTLLLLCLVGWSLAIFQFTKECCTCDTRIIDTLIQVTVDTQYVSLNVDTIKPRVVSRPVFPHIPDVSVVPDSVCCDTLKSYSVHVLSILDSCMSVREYVIPHEDSIIRHEFKVQTEGTLKKFDFSYYVKPVNVSIEIPSPKRKEIFRLYMMAGYGIQNKGFVSGLLGSWKSYCLAVDRDWSNDLTYVKVGYKFSFRMND